MGSFTREQCAAADTIGRVDVAYSRVEERQSIAAPRCAASSYPSRPRRNAHRPPAIALTVAALLCGGLASRRAFAVVGYTPLDVPGALATTAHGVSGSTIVGRYVAAGVDHGFTYNGTTYTPFNVPVSSETFCQGVDGSVIVGIFTDPGDAGGHLHGFIYNGSTYTTLDHPLAPPGNSTADTAAYGVSGGIVVGSYNPAEGITHGFTYNGTTYTNLPDHPLGINTTQYDAIYGGTTAGTYTSGGIPFGFTYNGSTFTPISDPLGVNGTLVNGIWGNTVVGEYYGAGGNKGFVYDGLNYMTLDVPGSISTAAGGIWGNTVVGTYTDGSNVTHGFVTSVPEPASLALACLGGVGGLCTRRRRAR
jgi:PEP-CTERM motif